jgi:hypothetical protein
MKTISIVIVMLVILSAAYAANGSTTTPSKNVAAGSTGGQKVQVSQPQAALPPVAQSNSDDKRQVAIMSQAEADSLRVQGDSLLAQSGVKEVPVGVVSTLDIIYVLVIVLLAVVIIRAIG